MSLKLLQDAHEKLQAEAQQMRNVLFAIVKEQGRVCVLASTVDGLTEEDGLDAKVDGKSIIVSYVKHQGGALDAPKESA